MLAALGDGRLANHSEQPGLQLALTAIDGLALKYFQIDHLQNFLGFAVVVTATAQRPAETGRMKLFEFRFKLWDFHFCVLVA